MHRKQLPLTLGLTVTYLNRDTTDQEITWAASSACGWTNEEGTPLVSHTPYDNGGTLILPWEQGMHINCTGIAVLTDCGTEVSETLPPETEPPYDPPIEYPETVTNAVDLPLWTETLPPEVEETLRDAAEDLGAEDEINDILEKYGCTAAVDMGSLTALLTLVAAACVIRKRK